jgi:hypothetical protein
MEEGKYCGGIWDGVFQWFDCIQGERSNATVVSPDTENLGGFPVYGKADHMY